MEIYLQPERFQSALFCYTEQSALHTLADPRGEDQGLGPHRTGEQSGSSKSPSEPVTPLPQGMLSCRSWGRTQCWSQPRSATGGFLFAAHHF